MTNETLWRSILFKGFTMFHISHHVTMFSPIVHHMSANPVPSTKLHQPCIGP